jgi:hypothetical protein
VIMSTQIICESASDAFGSTEALNKLLLFYAKCNKLQILFIFNCHYLLLTALDLS